MAVRRRFDFIVNGKGYMLSRSRDGRAWTRTSAVDSQGAPGSAFIDVESQQVDFSGPFGVAGRDPANAIQWAENMDLRFPGYAFHAQAINPISTVAHASWNCNANFVTTIPPRSTSGESDGDILIGGRGFLTRLTPAVSPANEGSRYLPQVTATAGDFLGPVAVFGSYIYVGDAGGTTSHRIPVGGGAGTVMGDVAAQMFLNSGQRMWRFFGDRRGAFYAQSISNLDAGALMTLGNWSATLPIGELRYPVRDVLAVGSDVYAATKDGLYQADQSGTFYNVLSEVRAQVHDDNGADIVVHNGAVIYPHAGGLLAYYPSTTTPLVRQIWRPPQTPQGLGRGSIRALATYGKWLYAGLWTGSTSHVLAGYDASPGLPYPFSPMQRLPHRAKVRGLHVDGVTTPTGIGGSLNGYVLPSRIWAVTEITTMVTGGTSPIYSAQIPRGDGMPVGDLTFSPNYVGSGALWLGQDFYDVPGVDKVFRMTEIGADLAVSLVQWGRVLYAPDRAVRTVLKRVGGAPADNGAFPTVAGADSDWDITADGYETIATPVATIADAAAATYGDSTYLFGGTVEDDNTLTTRSAAVYRYIEQQNTWQKMTNLPSGRRYAGATRLGAYIYVACGEDGAGAATNTLWRYSPETDTYTVMTSAPASIRHARLVVAGDSHILLLNAATGAAYLYSVSGDSWATVTAYPGNNTYIYGAYVNGLAYVWGDGAAGGTPTFYSYNASSDTWTQLSAPSNWGAAHGIVATNAGLIIAIGGNVSGTDGSTSIYTISTNAWVNGTGMGTLPSAPDLAIALLPSGCVMAFNGATVALKTARTSGGQYVTGRSLAISLQSFTASGPASPIWRSFITHSAVRPRVSAIYQARAIIGDGVKDRFGAPMRPGAIQLTELQGLEKRISPVEMIDLAGATHNVSILPPIQEVEVWQEGQEEPWVEAQITMAAYDFSGSDHA